MHQRLTYSWAWRRVSLTGRAGVTALLAVAPSYVVERITEYYFLTSNGAFASWSGDRTPTFIVMIICAAIIAGYILSEDLAIAAATYIGGIMVLLILLYLACIPRVCYSTGMDGLEPVRVGFFFSSLGIVGTTIGCYIRRMSEHEPREGTLSLSIFCTALVTSITYYPLSFTMAGARLLSQFAPFPTLVIVGLACGGAACRMSLRSRTLALVSPILSELVVLMLFLGIAEQYLGQVFEIVFLVLSVSVLGSVGGVLVGVSSASKGLLREPSPSSVMQSVDAFYARAYRSNVRRSSTLLLGALLAVLIILPVFLPDATAGIIPSEQPTSVQSGSAKSLPLSFGPSVYVGGFMTDQFVRPKGVGVIVDFTGTNASSIQPDNFLSAGIGAHSPHCCVDGIDFGYRFDVYLFHDGREALAASGWEICDWNMACGGHSWQNLIFFRMNYVANTSLTGLSSRLALGMEWQENRSIVWSYSFPNQQQPDAVTKTFAIFEPTSLDNPYFNVGSLGNVPIDPQPPHLLYPSGLSSLFQGSSSSGFYFFQYGMMSRYPIAHGGWRVTFQCPEYSLSAIGRGATSNASGVGNGISLPPTSDSNWECIGHSDSVQGDLSYWKVFWRWGEPYYNVVAHPNASAFAVTFSYSATSTVDNYQRFW